MAMLCIPLASTPKQKTTSSISWNHFGFIFMPWVKKHHCIFSSNPVCFWYQKSVTPSIRKSVRYIIRNIMSLEFRTNQKSWQVNLLWALVTTQSSQTHDIWSRIRLPQISRPNMEVIIATFLIPLVSALRPKIPYIFSFMRGIPDRQPNLFSLFR